MALDRGIRPHEKGCMESLLLSNPVEIQVERDVRAEGWR
jgi:hypothetical protein